MANPEILLSRGLGWQTPQWQAAEPYFTDIAELAMAGIANLGISYEESKRGAVRNVRPEIVDEYAGQAWGRQRFVIYTDFKQTPQLTPKLSFDLAATTVHEVVHNARAERYEYGAELEVIASEGLAYVAEYLFSRQSHRRNTRPNLTMRELAYDPQVERAFKLMMRAHKQSPAYAKWAGENTRGTCLSTRDLYGVQQVFSHVRSKHHSLEDLLEMSAEEILLA